MKKFTGLLCLLVLSVISCSKYDDTEIWDYVRDMNKRLTALEEKCREMNTNISSLQTIVSAAENGDYITNVAPVTKEGKIIGYTISFKKAEPITIYNGKDGENGINDTNGTNGTDGYTPVIGVKKDTDGLYYWTVDGEWLLDNDGLKVRASGIDGKDGTNGTNGTNGTDGINGTNGTNGADGITPLLKIEDEYWYVSYDSGATWQALGKATGPKGDEGESLFSSIEIGTYVVTFVLADGTTFTIPLQSSGTGDDDTPDGHERVDLGLPSGTLWATCNVGANTPEEYGDYYAWGETQHKSSYNWSNYRYCNDDSDKLTRYCSQSEYGYNGFTDAFTELLPVDDAATVNWGNEWQMPSIAQFRELILYTTLEWTVLNGRTGMKLISKNNGNSIFLTAAGRCGGTNVDDADRWGYYWSRTLMGLGTLAHTGQFWQASYGGVTTACAAPGEGANRCFGQTVRPVRKQ